MYIAFHSYPLVIGIPEVRNQLLWYIFMIPSLGRLEHHYKYEASLGCD